MADQLTTKATAKRALRGGAATERSVIEAATMLFYERGYHGTSVREIAHAVGIKAASLYNHFAGKQEILYAIALGSIEELLRGGQQVLERNNSAGSRLAAFVRFHVVYHARHRHRAKVSDDQLGALSTERLEEVLAVRDAYESILKDIVQQGKDEDGWKVDDVAIYAFAIATMCTAVGVWYRDSGRLTPEQVAQIYVHFVMSAVQADAPVPKFQTADE